MLSLNQNQTYTINIRLCFKRVNNINRHKLVSYFLRITREWLNTLVMAS